MRLHLSWAGGQAHAQLQDTPTSQRLWASLPLSGRANTWGEEVYFETDVVTELEAGARQVVDAGTVCFWVEGQAVALPYGPTPVSEADECRLVTEVNVLGMLEEDAQVLATVRAGDTITVRRAAS